MKLFYDVIDIISSISWTADIMAALVAIVLGVVWYNPRLFGTQWSQLSGHNLDSLELKKISPIVFLIFLFIAANITAFCKHFEWYTVDKSFLLGYDLGIMMCFFMALYALLGHRSLKRYIIEAGYVLCSMSAMGIVIGLIL